MTVGEEEDEKAFEEMQETWDGGDFAPSDRQDARFVLMAMRFAWDAAVKRGLSLRGCCEERDG